MLETLKMIIEAGAKSAITLEEIIKTEVTEWQNSKDRKLMLEGCQYYRGDADILQKERTIIGEHGRQETVQNLANNKLVHNFLRKLTDQKTDYLLSKPMSIQTKNEQYLQLMNDIFDMSMLRKIKNLGKEAINKGLAWMHVFYDDNGQLSFKKIPSEECIPLWRDNDHTDLDAFIRVYEIEAYEGKLKKTITKVEFWDTSGVKRYVLDGNLIPDVEAGEEESHFSVVDGSETKPANWERTPFICFKYNDEELPLIKFVKSLVDDYNKHKSDNSNNLEDLPNSIYVVKNYSGTNGGEFRKNISQYRVVFVENEGGVDTVSIELNTEAYKEHVERTRKDIYEFGRGVDTQQKEIGNSPSGIALKFLYADLDMDCNGIETEFQASLEQLRWFIDAHITNTTGQDYSGEKVDFIFNRDIPINETEAITNAKNSISIISDETIRANHPWVTDTQEETKRMEAQKQEESNILKDMQDFGPDTQDGDTE